MAQKNSTSPTFTKTETLRRLSAAARLVKVNGGWPMNLRAEVGTRNLAVYMSAEGVATVPGRGETWESWYAEDDDLVEIAELRHMADQIQLRQPGVVAHIYLSSTSSLEGQLETTCCVWLGDADHEPVQLDSDGTPMSVERRAAWVGGARH